jgi:F5/8 type C domain
VRRYVFTLAFTAALLFGGASAQAIDTSVGSWGGTARPMQPTSVRLIAESAQCVCYRRFAEYRVDCRFENSAEATTVTLGFPFSVGPDDYFRAAGFHVWRNGVALSARIQRGTDDGQPTDYYLREIDFPSGATTVTVDYLVSATSSDIGGQYALAAKGTPYAAFGGALDDYNFTAHTGADWAGTIDTAVLRWSVSPDLVGWGIDKARDVRTRISEASAKPDQVGVFRQRNLIERGFTQPDPLTYQYVFHDFEPTATASGLSAYDIGLHYFEPAEYDTHDNLTKFASPDVEASSWLEQGGKEYPPDALVDGNPSTAWAEGANGPGIGEHVDFTFVSTRKVRELRIVPGYALQPDLFAKYNRPKTLRIDYSDKTSQTVQLADDPTVQRFPANANAKSARITIVDVYRGTSGDDTFISEVEFGTAAAPTFVPAGTLLGANAPPSHTATETTSSAAQVASAEPSATAFASVPSGASLLLSLGVVILSVIVVVVVAVLEWRSLRRSKSDQSPGA